MNIPIVYQDNWLLVADKPAGLLVIPTPKKEKRTLTSILGLYPCHRLDRETSGLIIYAKAKSAQQEMMRIFKNKLIKKLYLGFAQGRLKQDKGAIRFPIDGRSALTYYRVKERRSNFSVVEIAPLTGRKNQIRLHFKAIGHPLVGETRFTFRKDFALKSKRLCLHAMSLQFIHPFTRKPVHISSELPQDLKDFLKMHK